MKKQIKKTVYEWCEENNRKDILNLWDYDLNNLTPKELDKGMIEFNNTRYNVVEVIPSSLFLGDYNMYNYMI